ncbi:MAG: N-acetyltransferase [Ilumatobacteraceae bacterium]|nr:N-acetyltransferase [Ilumatobacteraceae bacterium]
MLTTERLVLRRWRDDDRDAFADMNADPVVMRDLGGPLGRDDSDRKLDHYAETFDSYGYGRWAIERVAGVGQREFVGYAGVMPVRVAHPLGHHDEVGWRLRRAAWGNGYATEAARVALNDAFIRVGLTEVLSYTAPDNARSQAVMARLGLRRDASLDFSAHYDGFGLWEGLVWVASGSQLR